MQPLRFTGRIFPEAAQITVSFKPVINWTDDQIGVSMEFTCNIEHSKIDVECKLSEWRPDYLPNVHRMALDLCRAKVDLVAFKMGWGLTVMLETAVFPTGETVQIMHTDPRLSPICKSFSLEQGFDEICAHVLKSPPLFMALRDLISSISLPHVSPVDCARAIDRLKHLVAQPGAKDRAAWEQFRNALRIDEAYLKFITDHSADPRHGRPVFKPGTVTVEVTRRAWEIMDRYFEYLKRGAVDLDPSEFPLLVSPLLL